jgi:hypothetical protein
MQSIAQAWYITELTNEPAWLGIVAAAQFTPVMVLGLFGGVLADALPKHRALMGTQVSLMVLALLQAALVATGLMTLPLLILMAVLLGVVNAIDMPVRQSFFSEMVPEDEVGRAVAMNSAMFNGARVIGPAIGGVLIGVIGVAGCFAVNGASFLAVLLALLFMRADELRPAPRTPRPRTVADVLISLAEGVRFVARTPLIALCVFVIGVISGVAMNFNVIAPILARSVLEIGAPGLGLLSAHGCHAASTTYRRDHWWRSSARRSLHRGRGREWKRSAVGCTRYWSSALRRRLRCDRHGSNRERRDSNLDAASTARSGDERVYDGLRRLNANRGAWDGGGGFTDWGARRADRCRRVGADRHGVRGGSVANDPLVRGVARGARNSRSQPHQSGAPQR